MSQVPNFAKVDFADTDAPVGTGSSAPVSVPWLTPEGIAVKPVYGEQDLARLDFLDTYPGKPPFLRGLGLRFSFGKPRRGLCTPFGGGSFQKR